MAYLYNSNAVAMEAATTEPTEDDVCFGDETHQGTKKWRKAVRLVAKKHDEPYSPDIYRLIKKKLTGVRFFSLEGYPEKEWKEVEKKELVKKFGDAYDQAKNTILEQSFTERTDDVTETPPASPRRSKKTFGEPGSPKSPRSPRRSVDSKPHSSKRAPTSHTTGEPMMKTVTIYFPPPDTSELPEVSERLIPVNMCSNETIIALTSPPPPAATATPYPPRVVMTGSGISSGTPPSGSGVIGAVDTGSAERPENSIFGRSIFQVPNSHNRLVAEANFESFAPTTCICCNQCVGDQQRARTFARVYENRLEVNQPYAPWCCWTPEYCIVDDVRVYYFDKGPSQAFCGDQAELDCLAEICGQPVVFVEVPRCCCNLVDLRPCYGERIYAAPCTCCDLRWPWCCVGKPCYEQFACPFIYSMKDGKTFLAKYRGAVDDYAKIRPIKRHTRFHRVSEKPCGCDKVSVLPAYPIENSMYQEALKLKNIPAAIPNAFIMDRS